MFILLAIPIAGAFVAGLVFSLVLQARFGGWRSIVGGTLLSTSMSLWTSLSAFREDLSGSPAWWGVIAVSVLLLLAGLWLIYRVWQLTDGGKTTAWARKHEAVSAPLASD